ncbi:MAG TPA: trypsin-like peptidase domain-containing protein [Candidatus Saccharimonadales bacterium]|nr:trypsin-like peptidase domain-containing protein [Candidatus Saccharimonadales bacterium]
MGPDKKPKTTDEAKEHSVTSRPTRTVSFTVPTIPKPQVDWRSFAARAKASGVVVIVLAALVGGLVGGWVESKHNSSSTLLTGSLSNQQKIVTSESQLVNSIAKTVGASVVSVNVTSQTTSQNLFGFAVPSQEQAAGTGIIISSDGLIITNRHVVPAGTTSVSVTLNDGTELKNVQVVGRTGDSDTLDIAFLKIRDAKGHKLTPAVLGDSSKVQVGDAVVAIGNALGQFQNTVTSGIISGYGRSVQASDSQGTTAENLDDLFQTDAAINEGNSGGPLTNLNGQVIGINTAIAGNAQNIGFAIPINDVKGLVDQVLKSGKLERPYLGVRFIPLTADIAQQYGLSVSNGAYIAPAVDASQPSVVSGSPAESAGLKEGDVITKVDGKSVDQSHSLTGLLGQHKPGDKVTLTIVRDGKTQDIDVTLGTAPATTDTTPTDTSSTDNSGQ